LWNEKKKKKKKKRNKARRKREGELIDRYRYIETDIQQYSVT